MKNNTINTITSKLPSSKETECFQIQNAILTISYFESHIKNVLEKAYFLKFQKANYPNLLMQFLKELEAVSREIGLISGLRKIQESETLNILLSDLTTYFDTKNEIIKGDTDDILQIIDEVYSTYSGLATKKDTPVLEQVHQFLRRFKSFVSDRSNKEPVTFHEIHHSFILLAAGTFKVSYFSNISVEPAFHGGNEISKQTIFNFEDIVDAAITEIKNLIAAQRIELRCLQLPNKDLKIQVGSDKFEYRTKNSWEGWIFKESASHKQYKDLIIEDVKSVISAIKFDLLKLQNSLNTEVGCLNRKFSLIRTERYLTIKRNVNLFLGWPEQDRAFKSLRSRYKTGSIIILFIVLLGFALLELFYNNSFTLFFQFLDISIALIAFSVLFYIIYLVTNGIVSKGNHFRIERQDIISDLDEQNLKTILTEMDYEFTSKSDKRQIVEILPKSYLFKVYSHLLTHLSLYFNNQTEAEIIRTAEICNLEYSDGIRTKLVNKFYSILCGDTINNSDKELIKSVFPLQLIVIPAVNDPNIVELINIKIKQANYPNICFLIALEERDTISHKIVSDAVKNGDLPKEILIHYGYIEGSNKPGQLRKPKNKPKNVNKALSSLLNHIEGLFDNQNYSGIGKPDYIMIWDLEDDPGRNQIWNMIIPNVMIARTIEKLFSYLEIGKVDWLKNLKYRKIKNEDYSLYNQIQRWGIDLKLIKKLYSDYKQSCSDFSDKNDKLEFIKQFGIRADIEKMNNIERELSWNEKLSTKKMCGLNMQRNKDYLQNAKDQIINKYQSFEKFVTEEFKRRTQPVDTQAVLIAKMYGESPMSPLEWEFWFDLSLPGLMSFKFDKIIMPLTVAGAILGGLLAGIPGSIMGVILAGFCGYLIGRILLAFGVNFQNTKALSYSAGTTNNYNFDVLTYGVSLYPEYNIAEDWSVAIRLAQNQYQGLLVNGYDVPTLEDSLAPLGKRMWAQRSRWLGGHIQSFPQIFKKPAIILHEFGLFNWIHSFFLIVLFSLTPLLAGYLLFKSIFYLLVAGLQQVFVFFNLVSFSAICQYIVDFISKLNWWIPDDTSGVILFLIGPVVIILYGLVPILRARPDDRIMVDKSIADLKRAHDELSKRDNTDIKNLIMDIQRLKISSKNTLLSAKEEDFDQVLIQLNLLKRMNKEKSKKNKSVRLWDSYNLLESLINIYESKNLALNSRIEKLVPEISEILDHFIRRDCKRLDRKISRLNRGRIMYINFGRYTYSKIIRVIMNFGMVYYYYHCFFAVAIYLKQIFNENDNEWVQTAHRTYGLKYTRKIQKILIKEFDKLKVNESL